MRGLDAIAPQIANDVRDGAFSGKSFPTSLDGHSFNGPAAKVAPGAMLSEFTGQSLGGFGADYLQASFATQFHQNIPVQTFAQLNGDKLIQQAFPSFNQQTAPAVNLYHKDDPITGPNTQFGNSHFGGPTGQVPLNDTFPVIVTTAPTWLHYYFPGLAFGQDALALSLNLGLHDPGSFVKDFWDPSDPASNDGRISGDSPIDPRAELQLPPGAIDNYVVQYEEATGGITALTYNAASSSLTGTAPDGQFVLSIPATGTLTYSDPTENFTRYLNAAGQETLSSLYFDGGERLVSQYSTLSGELMSSLLENNAGSVVASEVCTLDNNGNISNAFAKILGGETVSISNTDTAGIAGTTVSIENSQYDTVEQYALSGKSDPEFSVNFGDQTQSPVLSDVNAILVGMGGATLDAGAGKNVEVALANGNSIVSDVNTTGIFLGGSNELVTGAAGGPVQDDASRNTVGIAGAAVNVGPGLSLSTTAGGETINTGAGDRITINNTNGAFQTVQGSGDSGGTTTDGLPAGIVLGANAQANVGGSNDTITLNPGDSAGVYGGGNTVNAGPGDYVVVGTTNGDATTVNATGDQSGALTANGQGTEIYVNPGAQANVDGGSDTIQLTTGDTLGLTSGGGYAVSGSQDAISVESNVSATVGGSGNSLYAYGASTTNDDGNGDHEYVYGTGGYFGQLGNSDSLTAEPGSTVNMNVEGSNDIDSLTNGSYAGVLKGTNDVFDLSDGTANIVTSTSATFVGSNDIFGAASGSTIGTQGTSNLVYQSGGVTNVDPGSSTTVEGSNETIQAQAGDAVGVEGGSNFVDLQGGTLNFDNGPSPTSATLIGSNTTINASNAPGATAGVLGSNDVVDLSNGTLNLDGPSQAVTLVGNATGINAGGQGGDTIDVQGSGNVVENMVGGVLDVPGGSVTLAGSSGTTIDGSDGAFVMTDQGSGSTSFQFNPPPPSDSLLQPGPQAPTLDVAQYTGPNGGGRELDNVEYFNQGGAILTLYGAPGSAVTSVAISIDDPQTFFLQMTNYANGTSALTYDPGGTLVTQTYAGPNATGGETGSSQGGTVPPYGSDFNQAGLPPSYTGGSGQADLGGFYVTSDGSSGAAVRPPLVAPKVDPATLVFPSAAESHADLAKLMQEFSAHGDLLPPMPGFAPAPAASAFRAQPLPSVGAAAAVDIVPHADRELPFNLPTQEHWFAYGR